MDINIRVSFDNPPSQELRDILAQLKANSAKLEVIHMATDDISNAQSRLDAAIDAQSIAITNEIEQLRQAVADLANVPNAADIAARISASADRIEASTAALGSDDPAAAAPEATA